MYLQKYQEESPVRASLIFFSRLKIEWSEEVSYRSSYPTILRCVLFPRHFLLDTCGAGDVSLVIVQGYKVSLFCRLVSAEIKKAPWPSDVFSPSDAPLHQVERDGKMVGVYSVGMNGVDNGGSKGSPGKDDYYFPLYGRQFPPSSATKTTVRYGPPKTPTSNRISRAP
jgi:hypothetical protein